MTDHIDLLRIIARDGGRLDSAARAEIAEAANEFQHTQQMLLAVQAQLIEANAHRIALNEVLLMEKRKQAAERQRVADPFAYDPAKWGSITYGSLR